MVGYGMNPVDLFEANDLFESGNMTQVQVSLLALAGKVRSIEGWWAAQNHTARRTRQTQAGPPKSHCLMWEAGRRESATFEQQIGKIGRAVVRLGEYHVKRCGCVRSKEESLCGAWTDGSGPKGGDSCLWGLCWMYFWGIVFTDVD